MPGFIVDGRGAMQNQRGPSSKVELARSHRYIVTLNSSGGVSIDDPEEITFYAKSCSRPSPEFDRVTMHHGMSEIYVPGKIKWAPVEIKFYERIIENYALASQDITAKTLYDWFHSILNYSTINMISDRADKLKLLVIMEMLDGRGCTVWKYTLHGAWPMQITPDALDYATSDASELGIKLSYDFAEEG